MALTQEQLNRIRQKYGTVSTSSTGRTPEQQRLLDMLDKKMGKQVGQTEQAEPEKKGFLAGIAESFKKRAGAVKETFKETAAGDITPVETGIQTVGTGFGFLGDVLGEGLKGAGRIVSAITPDVVEKKFKEEWQKESKKFKGSAIGKFTLKAISEDFEAYQKFKEKHPRAAKDIESVANIASFIPVGKGAQIAGKGVKAGAPSLKLATGRGATVLEKSVEASERSFVRRLIAPVQSKAVKEAQVARTTERGFGPFKRSIIAPEARDSAAENVIMKIPKVKGNKTFQQNYNIIREYNENLARKLESDIIANDFIIPKQEVMSKLNNIKNKLSESPLITGDAERTANKLLAGMEKIVKNEPGKASGIFKARKKYDRWVLEQKPKAFDAKAENAFTIANREIRQGINDLLEAKAPQIGIKKSLGEQSALYRAMGNLIPKAAIEADTAVGRLLQRVGRVLGIKSKVVQGIAAAAGIGGLGAAATFAPAVAALGVGSYVIYRGGKLILNPALRKYGAKFLREIEKALPEIKNPAMLKQMKQDKKVLEDLLGGETKGLKLPKMSLKKKTKIKPTLNLGD